MRKVIPLFFFIIYANLTVAQIPPCSSRQYINSLGLPPDTPIAAVAGHSFRIKDHCIPFDLSYTWKSEYYNDKDFYIINHSHVVPGELWYKEDTEEFVIIANPMNYTGVDNYSCQSAKARVCQDDKCKNYVKSNYRAKKTNFNKHMSDFMAMFPEVNSFGEIIPEKFILTEPIFKFIKGDDYYAPSPTKIDNITLSPLKYTEIVEAVRKKKNLTKSFVYNNNGKPTNPQRGNRKGDVKLSFLFHCPTELEIIKPTLNQKFVYDDNKPGKVIIEGEVKLDEYPESYMDNTYWEIEQISGVQVEYIPASRKGKNIKIVLTGLPKKNSDFGKTWLKASLDMGQKCGQFEDKTEFLLFFPRDAKNNPGNTEPNWYYYWQQTSAGHGTTEFEDVRYQYVPAGEQDLCKHTVDRKWWGYYPFKKYTRRGEVHLKGATYVNICDFSQHNSKFEMELKVKKGTKVTGIDTYAISLMHELNHRKHYIDWWNPIGGWPKSGKYVDPNSTFDDDFIFIDDDRDQIPDNLEQSLGYDKTKANTTPEFQEDWMYDEHHLTYKTADYGWTIGSADKEDWAKPGHQWP